MTTTIPMNKLEEAIDNKLDEQTGEVMEDAADNYDAKLYEQAVKIVEKAGVLSISELQTELKIGYAKAALIAKRMQLQGLVDDEHNYTKPPESPPVKSAAELEHDHYEQIRLKNEAVRESGVKYDASKSETSSLKKRFERLGAELSDLIEQDPRQRKLDFQDGDAAVQVCDEWREKSSYELGLAVGLTEKLVDNKLGTLGKLQDFWTGGGDLKDFAGIGEEKAAEVSDAFAAYGALHPELFGDEAEADAMESAEEVSDEPEELEKVDAG